MDPDSKRLRVAVIDGRGRPVAAGGLGRWLAAAAPARARGQVAVALVTDATVRSLNRRYRRQDVPTDVLAFPADAPDAPIPSAAAALGDIVIARGVARRQARAEGHPYQIELRVLALHGLLHLLGYDHHDLRDGGRMARTEARLRRLGGLPGGLIERASDRGGGKRLRPRATQSRRAVRGKK